MFDHVQLACPPGTEAASREFYRDVLGLIEVPKPDALADRGGCWFRGGGIELHLGVEQDFRPARKAHPGIQVRDLDLLADRLRTTGRLIVIDEAEIPGRRRFHTEDPHGNRLEFLTNVEPTWSLADVAGTAERDGTPATVRRARAEDVPAIISLLRDDPLGQDREHGDLTPYRDAFAEVDADPRQFLAVVVDDHAAVVGTCQLTFTPGLSRGGMLRTTIEGVRVHAQHRGRGLGGALIGWAMERATEAGSGLVQLTTDRSRHEALEFYRHLGFSDTHHGLKVQVTRSQ